MSGPANFDELARCFAEPIFDKAGMLELIFATGKAKSPQGWSVDKAHDELWTICQSFAFERHNELQPSTCEKDGEARKLVNACAIVLRAGGFADFTREPLRDELLPSLAVGGLFMAPPFRGEDGEAAIMASFRAVWQLRQDALKVREIMGRQRGLKVPRKGAAPERAIRHLAADLSHLYYRTWLDRPKMGVGDKGEATSPFLRMFVKVQNKLYARGLDNKKRNADALRKVWEGLSELQGLKFRTTGFVGADSFLPQDGK